jgi:hypothetical protein
MFGAGIIFSCLLRFFIRTEIFFEFRNVYCTFVCQHNFGFLSDNTNLFKNIKHEAMKRLLLMFTLCLTCVFFAKAEYDDLYTFEQGSGLAGISFGFLGGKTAVSGFYEYGLTKLFVDQCYLGGGFFGGFYRDKLGAETEKIYVAGLRANVHYQFVDRLDTYAGIDPNLNVKTYEIRENDTNLSIFVHAGARYYFTNWLAAFGELSTGFDHLRIGLSVKF